MPIYCFCYVNNYNSACYRKYLAGLQIYITMHNDDIQFIHIILQ